MEGINLEKLKYHTALFLVQVYVFLLFSVILSVLIMFVYSIDPFKDIKLTCVVGVFSLVGTIYSFKSGIVYIKKIIMTHGKTEQEKGELI